MLLSRHHKAFAVAEADARAAWDIRTLLFAAQFAVANDNASRIVVDGSRRCGKSRLAAVLLIHACLTIAKANCLFLALTREDARDLVWQFLVDYNNDFALGAKVNHARLELRFQNGSRIKLGGAKDRMQAERWRGRFYDLAIVDECQTFPSHLQDLVDSVLLPTMMGGDPTVKIGEAPRGRQGRIILMGTPGEVPGVGFWEEKVADAKAGTTAWAYHRWLLDDNPWLGTKAQIAAYLEDQARDYGGADKPAFRREFRGERVGGDRLDRPFNYSKELNHYDGVVLVEELTKELRHTRWALPCEGFWKFIFGIDLGKRSASAVCVWGVCDTAPGKIWLVEEWISIGQRGINVLAEKIAELRAYYDPLSMWVDEGGLGVMIADQWRLPPYSLPVHSAEKLAIEVQADFLDAALSRGDVRAPCTSRMAADMAACRWDPEDLKKGKRKIALEPHSDIIPAGRYGFKHAHQIAQGVIYIPPSKTDDERERAALDAERREAAERARRTLAGFSSGDLRAFRQ